jgi:hypothetical protein
MSRRVMASWSAHMGPAMSAWKGKSLSPAFLANAWRPGQSGNPGGHSGLYGEAVKLARGLSLRAVQRLGELMESGGRTLSVVACNSLLDRAFGKPKPAAEEKDDMVLARSELLVNPLRLVSVDQPAPQLVRVFGQPP